MRPRVLALVATGLAAAACSPADTPSCPGDMVAVFTFDGSLVPAADPSIAALDPVPALPDCTPNPANTASPILYPRDLPTFDAKLAETPATSAAALCRSNGVVYSGARTGASSYSVSADADPAVLCNATCAAALRVVIAGDVATGAGGEPTGFRGILVEELTASHGGCDGCLPLVPGTDPAERACAARYALAGTPR